MRVRIEGEKVILRSVESSDIDTILLWENSSAEPLYGVFEEHYTRDDVARFVAQQQLYPIELTEQMRLMICTPDGVRIGAIDLSNYDGSSAYVSILIAEPQNRGRGYGKEALSQLIGYAPTLAIRHLKATIEPNNIASIRLFFSCGFVACREREFILQLGVCE